MNIMKKFISVAAMVLMTLSCNNEVDSTTTQPTVNNNEAMFAMAVDATRTTIGEGGTSRWQEGDNIAVWAKDGEGNFAFAASTFMLRYFSTEWDKAYFVGNVAAMAEQVKNKRIEGAYLYVSAMGVYNAYVNGEKVLGPNGTEYLMAPGWTDYNSYVNYQTYDVTDMIGGRFRGGDVVIGIELGNGWYAGEKFLQQFQ